MPKGITRWPKTVPSLFYTAVQSTEVQCSDVQCAKVCDAVKSASVQYIVQCRNAKGQLRGSAREEGDRGEVCRVSDRGR